MNLEFNILLLLLLLKNSGCLGEEDKVDTKLGKQQNLLDKIVPPNFMSLDGVVDKARTQNYMVRLDSSYCQGVLIKPDWVLTNGECCEVAQVYGGGYDKDEKKRRVERVVKPKDYKPTPPGNTLCLVKLETPFKEGTKVAKLADKEWDEKLKKNCSFVEYGLTPVEKQNETYLLEMIEVNVAQYPFGRDEKSCGCFEKEMRTEICYTTEEANTGPCGGPGGALVCDDVVHGIYSYEAISKCKGHQEHDAKELTLRCGLKDVVNFFCDVGKNVKWINDNAKEEKTTHSTKHTTKHSTTRKRSSSCSKITNFFYVEIITFILAITL